MTQHRDPEISASADAPICAIIDACLAGDQRGYSQLYGHFASGLYRLCYSLLLNKQDAEDVTQDSFVYAFKNLRRFDREKASFKTWLYTIAISRCRNVFRKKIFPTVELSQIAHLKSAPLSEAPEFAVARRDAQEAILTALSSLSPPLRMAIVLRYGHHMTYREIAEVMGCPQKTAESRVRLAHEKLRGLLQPVSKNLFEELLGTT